MATRNLVPRTGSQGQIGTVSKPWKQAIFDTGSFQVIKGHLTPDAKETYDFWGGRVHVLVEGPNDVVRINFHQAKLLGAEYVISRYSISNSFKLYSSKIF